MKVLDLQCQDRHVFEGWFASEVDFVSQLERGLIECPICASVSISKMLSAPRLNLGAAEPKQISSVTPSAESTTEPKPSELVAGNPEQVMQAAWLEVARKIVAQTEDVGSRFAEEARKIHYGETEERGIRGQATREETESLLDEGIAIAPLILPESLKGPVQ
jgi:hypothetical protein